MREALLEMIPRLRALIHEAEPPYTKPHAYMNVDRPLTPLKHEIEEGRGVPRIAALRHALFLLDVAEEQLNAPENINRTLHDMQEVVAFSSVNIAMGILWANGIDEPAEELQAA